ncbi:MAG: hypothetical protein QM541_09065 [Flavobacterium sp.]|nr:hypothetical protein [Flavobacterium sp.]
MVIHVFAQPRVPKPHFNSFQPINLPTPQPNLAEAYFRDRLLNNPLQPKQDPAIAAQNLKMMQQSGMTLPGQSSNTNRQNQLAELAELKRDEAKEAYGNNLAHFQSYYNQLLQLNPNSFSITQAVYLCEAVYYDKTYPYSEFVKAIQQRADIVKQLLKQQGMSIRNGFALNYAIQQLFAENNTLKLTNGKSLVIKKIDYDFEDFDAEKDYTKMFVTKLLQTNTGQCHSMPLLYLCIAEQLGAKAWLSLAPEHSFIMFKDAKGNLSNFETTNGHLVSTTWLLQSSAISSVALKNNTYLDTLSSQKLYAQCLADFLMAYEAKNGYDDFMQQMSNHILSIDSNNIAALMSNANFEAIKFRNFTQQYKIQSQEQINNNPTLLKAQQQMQMAQKKVNNLGYQDMPKEQYLQWLQSIETEKAKRKQPSKQ